MAIGSTVTNVVENFASSLLLDENGVQLFDIRYLPVAPPVSFAQLSQTVIRLEGTYVKFYCKMDLKMQNRTVTVAADNESDDVNNAPLYGKSYYGPGVGTRFKVATITQGLSANVNTGIIGNVGANLGAFSSEPLDYQNFANVHKTGKIHLDGGQLKTSQLVKSFTMQFGNMFNVVNRQLSDVGSTTAVGDRSYVPSKIANYRLFAVEKMMDANPAGSLTNVLLAFEHNVRMSAVIKTYPQNSTAISFVKNRLSGAPPVYP